ncbi:MAG: DUF5666 domain-containing protein [Vicinamibacterales bacterium]
MRNWIVTSGALAMGALLTTACGDSMKSALPTAPSAVVAADSSASTASSGGASIGVDVAVLPEGEYSTEARGGNGNGNGNGNGKPTNPGPPSNPGPPTNTSPGAPTVPTNPGNSKVEIEGLIASFGGLSITVNGQTVLVPTTAVIRHGSTAFTFSQLQVGDRVHVRATKMPDATLQATEVILQNPTGDGNDEPVNDDGSASVRVAVLDAAASEIGADTGAFQLTRVSTTTLPNTSPLTVSFTLTGTALNGIDYVTLPLSATFLAGQDTVDVVVTPKVDALVEGSETVILTLTNASPYGLGTPTSATVTITEMPVVTVAAFDSSAAETPADTGTFRFMRNGSTAAALTVTYTLTGTALNGVDYQSLPITVTFLAGQATADVVVTPLADVFVEGAETVIITVVDGAAYDLGSPNAATITIAG